MKSKLLYGLMLVLSFALLSFKPVPVKKKYTGNDVLLTFNKKMKQQYRKEIHVDFEQVNGEGNMAAHLADIYLLQVNGIPEYDINHPVTLKPIDVTVFMMVYDNATKYIQKDNKPLRALLTTTEDGDVCIQFSKIFENGERRLHIQATLHAQKTTSQRIEIY